MADAGLGATPAKASPLVLALAVEPAAQAEFEAQRHRYFPAALNRVPAHISLFHALPGAEVHSIKELLREAAARTAPFPLEVRDVKKLGRGVAYALTSDILVALHGELRKAWLPWLTAQDQQGYRPHVVVQNKVDSGEARVVYAKLAAAFRPYTVQATGLLLWRYMGGPWILEEEFAFSGG
jgi:hypothetical protein